MCDRGWDDSSLSRLKSSKRYNPFGETPHPGHTSGAAVRLMKIRRAGRSEGPGVVIGCPQDKGSTSAASSYTLGLLFQFPREPFGLLVTE